MFPVIPRVVILVSTSNKLTFIIQKTLHAGEFFIIQKSYFVV